MSKKKLAIAVRASGTSVTEIFEVGPVIAATVIGDADGVARFASRDHFAAYNGTAPIEVSSGNRTRAGYPLLPYLPAAKKIRRPP